MKDKVMFTRWSMDEKARTPIAVNPERVDVVEFFNPAFVAPDKTVYPAATKIIMFNKQEYLVQGGVEEVTAALNSGLLPLGKVSLR